MSTAFIALGSNLANPLNQVNQAIKSLRELPETNVITYSPFYRTKPLGPQNQPDYLNTVIQLETTLYPVDLLDYLQRIEQQQGRERKAHRWGPRTLDLDILLYDDLAIQNQRLTIPHYDMKNREFMIYPLFDIAPNLVMPDGTKISELIKILPRNGMAIWQ